MYGRGYGHHCNNEMQKSKLCRSFRERRRTSYQGCDKMDIGSKIPLQVIQDRNGWIEVIGILYMINLEPVAVSRILRNQVNNGAHGKFSSQYGKYSLQKTLSTYIFLNYFYNQTNKPYTVGKFCWNSMTLLLLLFI